MYKKKNSFNLTELTWFFKTHRFKVGCFQCLIYTHDEKIFSS